MKYRLLPVVAPLLASATMAFGLLGSVPATAQVLYKIIAADGTVTYTDRPSVTANVRIVPVGRGGNVTVSNEPVAMPLVLREATSRFPVVLYTIPECAICDRGRELLRSRGIPYRERRADADTDRDTWTSVVGAPDAPVLTVGSEQLRGFSAEQWHATLDVAGYPRESRLPPNYQVPAVAPLVERRREAPRNEPEPGPAPPPIALPNVPPGGIRF